MARVREMEGIAVKGGYPLARAALGFPLQDPMVKSLLLGTATVRRLQQNIEELSQPVPAGEFEKYQTLALS